MAGHFDMVCKTQLASYMTSFFRFCVGAIATTASLNALADVPKEVPSEVFQSIQLGITQQSQLFELNDDNNSDTRLNVWGSSAQYQIGKGPWNLIADYHQADASSNNNQRDELDFQTQSVGLFVEYYLENTWLALGYSNSEDTTDYPLNNYTQISYQSFILESGYIHDTQSGQFSATWGLTQQYVKEDSEFNSSGQVTAYQIDEEGILTSLTISYGRFFPLSDALQVAINAGLRREITLSGDGRIQQSTRQGGPGSTQTPTSEDLQSTSQSASTSQQAQISLQHLKGSISLSIDKLSDQSFSNSYFSAGLRFNF